MRTNVDATLYAKTIVSGSEVWTRSAIYKVFWENRKAANVIKSGLLAADSVSIYIPFTSTDKLIKVGDVMVKGIVTDIIHALIPAIVGPPAIAEIPAFTMTMLKVKYADVITVKSNDTKDFGSLVLQHWQIGGS